jgi:FKBP-type peptidyl-prolyl cis-trans isomerase
MKYFLYLLTVVAVTASIACGEDTPTAPSATPETGLSNITTLQITDVKVGDGAEATSGRSVTVHYTGWLYSQSAAGNRGSKFDSSRDRNQPFPFTLGVGQVIRGWDQGVAGMKVGGQRTLVIPPGLAYGSQGSSGGQIPPNATLVFDVELLDVR